MTEPTKEDNQSLEPAKELTRDERILKDLADRYGAGVIVDAFLGIKQDDEPTGTAKPLGTHKRPVHKPE